MCKYCDNTESLLTAYYETLYWGGTDELAAEHLYVNPSPEWIDEHEYDGFAGGIDVCVNTLNEFPALLITGTLPFTVPAIPIHYCPACGRKLD